MAGVQMSPIAWDAAATVNKMSDVTERISLEFPWVQMILFHELVVPGVAQFVSAGEANAWRKSAQSIPGALTDQLCDLARQNHKWLIPGSMYESVDGKIYNTALAISPEGKIVAKYRKMFPWLPYESGTSAGDQFCVFDVPDIGRFGLCICYDIWFPEVVRNLVWLGAEVILHPTLTATSDRALELVLSQANAISNQCYFISVNGLGPFGGGKSLMVDPDGRVLQQAGDHETIMTEVLDLDHVTRTREYGTIGLGQTLKQLRDSNHVFPMYQQGINQGEGFKALGKLQLHRDLNSHLKRDGS
jgi:predicted amidohydrolase